MRIATWQWGGRRHAGFVSADGRDLAGRPPKPAGAKQPVPEGGAQ
jgi:hypothetical protein